MLETILGLVQKIGSQKIILYVCKGSKFNAIISDRELKYPLPPLLPDRPYARPGVGGLTFPVGAFQNGHFNISTGFIG